MWCGTERKINFYLARGQKHDNFNVVGCFVFCVALHCEQVVVVYDYVSKI